MVIVRGMSLDELTRRTGEIDTVIERQMRTVADKVAAQLGQTIVAAPTVQATSPNDVNAMRTLWREIVDFILMRQVSDALFSASRSVARDFNRILDKVLDEQPNWRPPNTRGTDGRRQAPPTQGQTRVYQPPPPTPRETDDNVDFDLPDDDDDFYLDPLDEGQTTEAILDNARNRLVGIGDDMWEVARDELVAGMNEGESIDKLAARVRGAADVATPRARTIARTEVISACNAGSLLTMRSSELATAKIWLSTSDARTRLDHLIAQGQTVPIDEPFLVGGTPLDHPGDTAGPPDQVINCRCTQAFDVEELPTPEGEEDSDDIEGFDPSMFPDVDFSGIDLTSTINHTTQRGNPSKSTTFSGKLLSSTSPEVIVSWHIERNHSGCDPDQWAVVNSDDDEVKECFADKADAIALFDELTNEKPDDKDTEELAAEDGDEKQCLPGQRWDDEAGECVPGEGKQETAAARRKRTFADKKLKTKRKLAADTAEDDCPPGQKFDEESGECIPDEEMNSNIAVQGVAVVEGMWTGDGRQFAVDSLNWPDPQETRLALQWQKETSHGGDNDNTVNVGWLETLERDGDRILVTGVIDSDSADGAEAARFLAKRGRFGVSIVADDPDDSEIEFVYPEECETALEGEEIDGEEIPMACFMPKVIFHSGRIRALTMVDVPAFVEAYIEPAEAGSVQASGRAFGAVAAHETETTDTDWDAAAQEKKLGDEVTLDAARGMYAWVDEDTAEDDIVPKDACKFPHHEVSDDGTPGAANLTACSAGIGALNGARGGADIPDGDKQGVYDHLAEHLRSADQEPPPPSFTLKQAIAPLIAAAHQITLTDTPPAEWFAEPADLPEVGAIAVTDEGRVYGLLAPRHVAHRSFDKRITVPTGNVDYSRWMNRQTIVAGGDRVTTGPITMGCGHAATDPWVDSDSSRDHYDNSCSVVATVRIGENKHGVWIAGALLPDVTPHQVARMLACQLSGDWRPHPEKPGKREMCGALLVPVPGFPVSATASVRMDHGQLVAAAAPVLWQTADTATVSEVATASRGAQRDGKPGSVSLSATPTFPSWEDVQRRKQNRLELEKLSAQIGIEG